MTDEKTCKYCKKQYVNRAGDFCSVDCALDFMVLKK